jgi:dTDP-4-amino-4,6-dideoxygalactose transaminase
MNAVLANRRRKYVLYQRLLSECSFISFQKFQPESYNFSYMPVLFRDEAMVIAMAERLKGNGIVPRRYFYPSLNTLKVFGDSGTFPVAEDLARRVLCLPLFDTLPDEQIEFICSVIKS